MFLIKKKKNGFLSAIDNEQWKLRLGIVPNMNGQGEKCCIML